MKTGNDLVLCLQNQNQQERVGELVGTLCKLYFNIHSQDMNVNVRSNLSCHLGSKSKMVSVENSTMGPIFKKNGAGLVLHWPSQ